MDHTDQPSPNQTGNELVPFLDCSKNTTNTQHAEQHVVTTRSGDTTTSPLTTATPLIEEGLVPDEQTNEIYLPLSSTKVLKRKQEMLYVPLDFENNLTVDALVDSGAFVSAIAQDDLETINDPYPEVGYFSHHSGQPNSPETGTNPHMVTENCSHTNISTA